MSEKGKARKLEEHNSSKPLRGHSGGLPPMGPGMVPHHNYAMQPDGYHSGGLAYRPGLGQLIGQSIPMRPSLARVPISNDMGPPIFMPSLNLGTPKQGGTSGNMAMPPSSHSNSKLKQPPNICAGGAFMTTDLPYPQASLSAFHSAPIKPVPYMPPPSSVPPKTAAPPGPTLKVPGPSGQTLKTSTSSAPSTSIAKPTPLGHPMVPVTKVVTAMDRDLSQPAFSTGGGGGGKAAKPSQGVAKLLAPSSESVPSGGVKGEGLATMLSQPYYPPPPAVLSPQVTNSLSKMLMAPSPPQEHPEQTGSNSGSKPPPGGVYSGVGEESFLARNSTVQPPPATSGQPSSNVTFTDTRLERPPQPSAPQAAVPGAVPMVPKERSTATEVTSNIIISNPGLTGKHIAAMTNSSQPPSTLLSHSAYSSPISSAEMLPGPSLPLSQQLDTGWGYSPQHNSYHNPLSPPVTMATSGSAGLDASSQQSNGGGLKSRLEAPALPQSPQAGGGGGPPMSGGESGLLCSPGQINSSPRPRILRGKRPLDGNWKLDGQSNSICNPGSPHRTKVQTSLKKAMALPLSGEQPPSPEGARPLNHVGVDFSASPRKKPRKQNVVANDDQYASNVPDTLQQLILQQQPEVAREDPPQDLEGGGNEGSTGTKEVEIRYLSQLRQSPYPINGVYKLRHHVAHNHFRRYADIKQKSSLPISVYDLSNDRSSQHRASGWKLFHFNSQLEDVDKMEMDCLELMEKVQESLETFAQDSSCLLDSNALKTTKELLQGNIDRCKRARYHLESTTANMFMVLDQRSHVVGILDKYSNFKSHFSSISPSLSSSSSHHHKSQS